VDGNGRTGRALLHTILRESNVLLSTSLPLSAGLLNNIDAYMSALREYQSGNYVPIIEQLVEALELALVIASELSSEVEHLLADWEDKITEKKTSRTRDAIRLLIQQPVITADYLSQKLTLTPRAARDLIGRLVNYGILAPMSANPRKVFYQAPAIIAIIESMSGAKSIQRLFPAANKP
jgi:Fic family protein